MIKSMPQRRKSEAEKKATRDAYREKHRERLLAYYKQYYHTVQRPDPAYHEMRRNYYATHKPDYRRRRQAYKKKHRVALKVAKALRIPVAEARLQLEYARDVGRSA